MTMVRTNGKSRHRARTKPLKISLRALEHARQRRPHLQEDISPTPFKPYTPPHEVTPEMAMDDVSTSAFAGVDWAQSALSAGSVLAEGQTFLGYPELALMAQRPEYRVISETIAMEATRTWIEFEATGDEDKTEKLQAIEEEFKRLDVRHVFRRASEYDGFFGRGHLYIDTGDTDNPAELKLPIGNGKGALSRSKVSPYRPIKRIRAIEPVWSYPTTYNSGDPLKPDWYKPSIWYVMGKQIHASRLLTFIAREVPDLLKPAYSFGGLSMSQMAKPYVDNWLRTRQAVSDIIKSFTVFVLKTDMTGVLSGGAGSDDFFKRLDLFNLHRDNSGVLALNASEEFTNISAPISSLDKLQAQSQEQMAAVSKIPLVKLTGISPSGLNASSEGELRCFEDTIAAYQESVFRPNLTTILCFVQLSLFGEVDPEIDFTFNSITEMTDKEKADLRQIEAMTGQVLIDSGAIDAREERVRVSSDPGTPYEGLDLDMVPGFAAEAEAMASAAAGGGAFGTEAPGGPPPGERPPAGKPPSLNMGLKAGAFRPGHGFGSEAGFKALDEFKEEDHPRAGGGGPEAGRFVKKGEGGGQAGEGGAQAPEKAAEGSTEAAHTLYEKVKRDGGFSYRVADASSPKPGDHKFAVAYSKTTEQVVDLDKFTPTDLVKYIKGHLSDLTKPGVHIGAWVSDGKVYLDCSIVSEDEKEVQRIAKENSQLAYFNFENMTSVDTPK